jgi:hypothetical protein
LTSIAIVDETAGELAKTLGATSSGMAGARKIYLVRRPFRGLIRTDVSKGVAMGPLKLRKTIGLSIGMHRCPVTVADPRRQRN